MHLNCDKYRLTAMILKAAICVYCHFFYFQYLEATIVIFMFPWLVMTMYAFVYMFFVYIVQNSFREGHMVN